MEKKKGSERGNFIKKTETFFKAIIIRMGRKRAARICFN